MPTPGSIHRKIQHSFHPCCQIPGMDSPAILPLLVPAWVRKNIVESLLVHKSKRPYLLTSGPGTVSTAGLFTSSPTPGPVLYALCSMLRRLNTDPRGHGNLVIILLLGTLGLRDLHLVCHKNHRSVKKQL
jgi:hypothetical protein